MNKLTPMSGQEAINEIIDYFLGEDWYVADPLSSSQVNAIAVDDIKLMFPKNKRNKFTIGSIFIGKFFKRLFYEIF